MTTDTKFDRLSAHYSWTKFLRPDPHRWTLHQLFLRCHRIIAQRPRLNMLKAITRPFLPLRSTDEPRRIRASGFVRPVLRGIRVRWLDSATGYLLHDVDETIEYGIGEKPGYEAVCDRVREGHADDGYECWKSVADVRPVNEGDLPHHHASYENERASCCPGWDGCEDWREEDRDQEADAGCDGSQSCPSPFSDAGAGLDERCRRRTAKQGPDGYGESIAAVC